MREIFNKEAVDNIMLSEKLDKQFCIVHSYFIVAIAIAIVILIIINNYFGLENFIKYVFQ